MSFVGKGPGKSAGGGKKKIIPKKTAPKKETLRGEIRKLSRLVDRGTLPPLALEEKRKLLDRLKKQLESQQQEKTAKTLQEAYKMPRFFDRRKIMRQMEKLDKADLPKKEKQEKRAALEKDMEYVVHFPPDHKYISLRPSADPAAEKDRQAKVAEIREIIQRNMETKDEDDTPQFVPEQDDFFSSYNPGEEEEEERERGERKAYRERETLKRHGEKALQEKIFKHSKLPRQRQVATADWTKREKKNIYEPKRKDKEATADDGDDEDVDTSKRKRSRKDNPAAIAAPTAIVRDQKPKMHVKFDAE